MIAVLTPEQMKLADAAALSSAGEHHESVFIERAGYAVAQVARRVVWQASSGHSWQGPQWRRWPCCSAMVTTVGCRHNFDERR